MLIFICIDSIDLVITGHDGFCFSFFNRNFKPSQINLPQCPFIQYRIHCHPAKLLAVNRKMLRTCIDSLTLDSSYIRCSHLSRQIRIFRKIFKIPSTQRAALNVQSRSQKYMLMLLLQEPFQSLHPTIRPNCSQS